MRTVIVRLSGPTGDGELHGLAEVVGTGTSVTFADDRALLSLLRAAAADSLGAGEADTDLR
jgi:hypothetical protein